MNFTINHQFVAKFEKLVANANKKAAKLGVPAYTYTVGEAYTRPYTERNITRYETVVPVTLNGTTPKFNGWKLVGVVSPLKTDSGEILPIVTTVPGETVKTNGQSRDPLWCDHCKVRRDRLESFIVQHDDGSERQVGRNCLCDFLGDARMSPTGLANLMNTIASISDSVAEWHKAPRQFDSESLTLVLAMAKSVIRVHGWVSSKEAYNRTDLTSTKTHVSTGIEAFLNRPEDQTNEQAMASWRYTYRYMPRMEECMPTDEDFAAAATYREHLSVLLDEEQDSDYIQALRILSFAGTVNRKAMGIAVSIINFVDRKLNVSTDPLKALLANANKTSQFVGEPRKRQVFKGVTFVENFQTGQGFSVATFVTPEGNILKTFSHQTLLRGAVVDLKATVVRHDTYKGVNQTVVNRPVVM